MLQHDVAYLALTDVRPMRHNSGVELNCLSANGEQQPTHRSTWLEQDFVTCPGDVDAIFATYQLTNTTSYCAHRCCPLIISWADKSAEWNPCGFLLTNLYDH